MEPNEKKLDQRRISALELAKALGNVSEACRRRGVSRNLFYVHKKRFQTHGIIGLVDLPFTKLIPKLHPLMLSKPCWKFLLTIRCGDVKGYLHILNCQENLYQG